MLLDGIHDEIKLLRDDCENNPWGQFMSKNKSIIGENIYGMTQTLITCPNCNFCSEIFEPFITFPVQIPNQEKIQITLYIVFSCPDKIPQKRVINCFYSWSTLKLLEMLENEHGCKFVVAFYHFFEVRGLVEKKDIGDYKGNVLIAYEKNDEVPVFISVYENKNRVIYDRVIFLPNETDSELFISKLLRIYKNVFISNSIDLDNSNFSEVFKVKFFKNSLDKADNICIPEEGKLDYMNNTRFLVEFPGLELFCLKLFNDLPNCYIADNYPTDVLSLINSSLIPETLDESNK